MCAYRGSSNYHKIRHTVVKQQGEYDSSENFFITLTQEAADKFKDCVFEEHILNNGVLLMISGGDINKT